MNQDVKTKWLAALRSGEYLQARGRLRRANLYGGQQDGFCCLGVLCELAVQESIIQEAEIDFEEPNEDMACTLPAAVVRWAELPDDNPQAGGDTLSSLNDNSEPFTRIADVIEDNL